MNTIIVMLLWHPILVVGAQPVRILVGKSHLTQHPFAHAIPLLLSRVKTYIGPRKASQKIHGQHLCASVQSLISPSRRRISSRRLKECDLMPRLAHHQQQLRDLEGPVRSFKFSSLYSSYAIGGCDKMGVVKEHIQ